MSLLSFQISRAGYLPFRYLFSAELRTQLHLAKDSKIYLLAKVPKVRIMSAFYAPATKLLSIDLTCGATARSFSIDLIKANFVQELPRGAGSVLLSVPLSVVVASEGTLLRFTVGAGIVGEVSLVELIAMGDFDLGFRPRVLYVGQSEDVITRWERHEKLLAASAKCGDLEELRIYFVQLDFATTVPALIDQEREQLRIDIAEQVLIKFFLPELNDQHKNASSGSVAFSDLRAKFNVSTIFVDVGVKQRAFGFWSNAQALQSDFFVCDISQPSVRFTAETP